MPRLFLDRSFPVAIQTKQLSSELPSHVLKPQKRRNLKDRLMQVYGNIGSDIVQRTGGGSGKPFWTFRLAENQGKDENRTTTWYEVAFFGSEVDADLLQKGQFVKVTGRVESQVYQKRDQTWASSLRLSTGSVIPQPKREGAPEGEGGQAPRAAAPAAAPARAAAPAAAPAAPPTDTRYDNFSDMDDDIPF